MLRRTAQLPPGSFELFTDPELLHNLDGNVFKTLVGIAQHAHPTDTATWAVRKSQDEIADALGMTPKTFRKHLRTIAEGGASGGGGNLIYIEPGQRHRDPDVIWLLWTAPMTTSGDPWRPPQKPTKTDIQDGNVYPGNFSPGNNYPSKTSPPQPGPAPHHTPHHAQKELPHLHAQPLEETNKNAGPAISPRLLNGQPCPPHLDKALADLGYHGDINTPHDMAATVTVADLHAIVERLLAHQAEKRSRGKTFNAAGTLANRLKNPRDLHAELVAAGATDYLTRHREATATTRPPWCGHCHETTRMREQPETGLPYRCPTCHPLEATLPEAL